MKAIVTKVAAALKRVHADERGAEGLEKLLIIGAIVLPLLAVLLVFRKSISEWLTSSWEEVSTDAGNIDKPDFPVP